MTLYSKNVSITKKKNAKCPSNCFSVSQHRFTTLYCVFKKKVESNIFDNMACIRYESQATVNSNVQWKNSIQRNIINFRNGFPNESF